MDFNRDAVKTNKLDDGVLCLVRILRVVFLAALILAINKTSSEASWLIYHKPEFKGKVFDAETKKPIEGAVVVVKYMKYPLIDGPGGNSAAIENIREALTDKEGTFRIPSYTTLIPFSLGYKAVFIVYKPGYASITDLDLEEVFSMDSDKKEVEMPWLYNKDMKFEFAPRYVGLPRLKTKEERKQARMDADIFGADVSARELPILFKTVDDERKRGF